MPADTLPSKKPRSSPEQLDQLMVVTSPLGWLGLLTTMALLLVTVLWGLYGKVPLQVEGPGILLQPGGLRSVSAMAAGRVVDVLVHSGDVVDKGQVVARVQPLALYPATASLDLTSSFAGVVTQVAARPGVVLQVGDSVLTLGSLREGLEAVLYLPINQGKKIEVGQAVQVTVSSVDREQFGYVRGTVKKVSVYATSAKLMQEVLGSEELVRVFTQGDSFQAAPIEISVSLTRDLTTPSGYKWSSKKGPPRPLAPGTVCTASIVTSSERPIDLVVPFLLERFGAEPQK